MGSNSRDETKGRDNGWKRKELRYHTFMIMIILYVREASGVRTFK